MFINHPLAATNRETTRCVHFTVVGQICQKIDTRAGVSLLFPVPHRASAGRGTAVVLLLRLHEREFLRACPTHMHHHEDQLQPQYSPYLALIKSENAAAQIAYKM